MAYQNFFVEADNKRRVTPVTCSGKTMTSEFRMRNNGGSELVVACKGQDNEDGTISSFVKIYENEKILAQHKITYPK